MNINEDKIKNLIKNPHSNFEEIKKELSEYIYYFPRVAYKKNLDICGDFYLYIIERLDKILLNFNPNLNIKFKTWFNYVLRNNFINFNNLKREPLELNIENYEESICFEVFEEKEGNFNIVDEVLKKIEEIDRILLKLYYIPELITEEEVLIISDNFNMSISEVLNLQRKLIELRTKEIEKVKEISEKIKELNNKIVELKYTLYQNKIDNNDIITKIARLENQRFNYILKLKKENNDIFESITILFKSKEKTRYRLKIAKEKFKFYYLKHRAG